MKGKTKIAVLVFFVVIFTIFSGVAVIHHNHFKMEQSIKSAALAAQKVVHDKEIADRAAFNALLNAMIKDLSTKVTTYKKQRIILKEAIHPLNFEKPEFAQDSYTVFKNDIIPMLRKTADQTIELFQIYDNKAQNMLKSMPTDLKSELQTGWDNMKKKQLDTYISLFSKEEEIIQAHQKLIKFYAVHCDSFILDEEGKHLIFDNPSDAEQEKKLRDTIKTLQTTE